MSAMWGVHTVCGTYVRWKACSLALKGCSNIASQRKDGICLLHINNDQLSCVNQDTALWGWARFYFLFFNWRPNCIDLPCSLNSPIVKLCQWDKQLPRCFCDIKHNIPHASCPCWPLRCLIITISVMLYIIRSVCINIRTVMRNAFRYRRALWRLCCIGIWAWSSFFMFKF